MSFSTDILSAQTIIGLTISGDTLYGDGYNITNINEQDLFLWDLVVQGNRLLSGYVSYVSGLTFDVTPLSYIIEGNIYEVSATTQVTLTSGDSTFDRIDVIYADISGNTGVLIGTPSANPEKPVVDGDTQVEITFVSVPANGTTPGNLAEFLIYDENTGPPNEWTFLNFGPQNTLITSNSTEDAYSGITSIKLNGITGSSITNYGNGFILSGTTGSIDTNGYATIQFAIKNFSGNTNTNRFKFRFLNQNGSTNGTSVYMNGTTSPTSYLKYIPNNTSTWQVISIPIWKFYLTNTNVYGFEVALALSTVTPGRYRFDTIKFVEGASSSPPSNSWTSIKGDTTTTITATNPNATLTISGGTNINTSVISPSTLRVDLDSDIVVNNITANTLSSFSSIASGTSAIAFGYQSVAGGTYSFSNGLRAKAYGSGSNSHGRETTASGYFSHAEGRATIASGYGSHSEGQTTNAIGDYSHAEGNNTTASGYYSHAEGSYTKSTGGFSHSEGLSTSATTFFSHAQGAFTLASGYASHAEGSLTTASGSYSHSEGLATTASGNYQLVVGQFNTTGNTTSSAFIIGNGTGINNRTDLLVAASSAVTINYDLNVFGKTLLSGLTATTISATTYQNLPLDINVTGGTYNYTGTTYTGGTITFVNNTGGTFNVSSIRDTYTTGFTYDSNSQIFTLTNNSGQSLSSLVQFTGITGTTYVDIQKAIITASTTTTSATYVDIPGLSATTKNLGAQGTYLINSSGYITYNGLGGSGYVILNVDGVQLPETERRLTQQAGGSAVLQYNNFSTNTLSNLTSGKIVKVQFKSSTAGGTTTVYSAALTINGTKTANVL